MSACLPAPSFAFFRQQYLPVTSCTRNPLHKLQVLQTCQCNPSSVLPGRAWSDAHDVRILYVNYTSLQAVDNLGGHLATIRGLQTFH